MDRIESSINPPVDYKFTDQDIINEYKTVGDKKKVAVIYKIPVAQVTEILKQNN
jgi:dihydrodipicolinate synthase/N-acetylneuraminate lyase